MQVAGSMYYAEEIPDTSVRVLHRVHGRSAPGVPGTMFTRPADWVGTGGWDALVALLATLAAVLASTVAGNEARGFVLAGVAGIAGLSSHRRRAIWDDLNRVGFVRVDPGDGSGFGHLEQQSRTWRFATGLAATVTAFCCLQPLFG